MSIHRKYSNQSSPKPFHPAILGLSDKLKANFKAIQVRFFVVVVVVLKDLFKFQFWKEPTGKPCYTKIMNVINQLHEFPGGLVVKSLLANVEDTGLIPGPRGSHVSRGN